jgi:hypothetical protein
MYALRTLKELRMPNGQPFHPGQTCNQLSWDEAAELLAGYPDCFEPADAATVGLAKDVRATWFESEGPIGEIYASTWTWVIAVGLGFVTLAYWLIDLVA